MPAPFIYIGTNRMKTGMPEGYRRDFMPKLLQVVETNEPLSSRSRRPPVRFMPIHKAGFTRTSIR